ncbi:hypothetical protein HIM_09784 [Hirsutella minnesotensis 3608]|uniref:Uncharacterized protein n=1 Tax=Hirsutella minnesotensis 3608 TaxID=1043627 RepID=A0A0F7ZKX9_9HYPO|nr:hypothetical protein HIM_09784 [Hirsutella minnesotensis 3608]
MSTKVPLNVPGFPDFLCFGGFVDLTEGNEADLVAAKASAIFRYAGLDGAGDASQFLTEDSATTKTIALARSVEKTLGGEHRVVPVLVSYTCNLSSGDIQRGLQDSEGLAHSFGNLILSLRIAIQQAGGERKSPAAYIVNPDFISTCQQQGLSPDFHMPVRQPLSYALERARIQATIPNTITETLRGHVQAVNWLIRTVAPDVAFGYSVNIWGGGSAMWVQSNDDPRVEASKAGDYIKSLGVLDGGYRPNFIAIDRYEADDFTVRAYTNGYCYGPREWARFFDFCGALGEAVRLPVMVWQMPASHLPASTDAVNGDFDSQHWGTGGSYLFGDSAIGSDLYKINERVLALRMPEHLPSAGKDVKEVFQRAEPFDLSKPAYESLPSRGIFAVFLGGGATTGLVSSIGSSSSWARDKVKTYMNSPIPLK